MLVPRSKRPDREEGEETLNEILSWGKEHALFLLLFFATAVCCVWLSMVRKRLKMPLYAVFPVAVLHTLIGVLSVKIFAFLETGLNPDSLGNISLFGGVFFMPLVYWAGAKLTKRNLGLVCDLFTPCMVFTVMCARVNCIVSGCCSGLVIPGTHVHFPTRELEILYYIVMLILLIPRVKKSKNPGSIYPLYMASYGAFRFIDEFFRTSSTGMLFHLSHVWAAIAFAAGLSIYIEINARNHQRKKVIKK